MRIAIVGAGALGRAYGVRLAMAGADVRFVVRAERAASQEAFVIEQVNGDKERCVLDYPRLVTAVPADSDIVLVAVHLDQIVSTSAPVGSTSVPALLAAAPNVPIVSLTPLFSKQIGALEAASGKTVLPGMPGVTGYIDERGALRYWVPRLAMTFFDQRGAKTPVEELARKLTRIGIPTQLEKDVGSLNAATTIAFFPFTAALEIAGSVDGVLADKELVHEVLDAVKECDALAKKVGRAASWAQVLSRFIGPYTLKPGIVLARRIAPESVKFVEVHFGPKLAEQHQVVGAAILEMGHERGVPMGELQKLLARVAKAGLGAEGALAGPGAPS